MSALGTTFLLGANEAQARPQRYRATPLVKLNLLPNADTHGTAGINNKGQVVYAYSVSGSLKPWIWLPEADTSYVSGFTAAGFHELTLTGGAPAPGIARDVNETGDVAGQTGMNNHEDGDATVWRLTQSATPFTIAPFSGSAPVYSGAFGISDHTIPIVVGEATKLDNCECPAFNPANETVLRGFYAILSSTTPVKVELATDGNDSNSLARDVALPVSGAGYFIVGDTHCNAPDGNCRINTTCEPSYDPRFWNSSTSPAGLTKLSTNGGYARAVSKRGYKAGFSRENNPCLRHANFWSASGTLTDLGDTMPSGQSIDASRAEGMNHLQNPQVVGWNESSGNALLWEYNGSSWSVLDLQSTNAIGVLGGAQPKFALEQAHDINDSGWIITIGNLGFGTGEPTPGLYAVLLTPYDGECPADINVDNSVNVPDLLAVIAQWGSCPVGAFCTADVNLDFHVNVTDLLAVITNWGPCGEPSDGAPESVEDCHQECATAFGVGTPEYTDCMDKCIRALCESGALPPEDCE